MPKFELVKETIARFSKIMRETEDFETLTDAAWALSGLSNAERKQNIQVRSVFDLNVCQGLVAHIKMDQDLVVLVTLLQTLGNLLSATEEQTSEVLKVPDIVDKLLELATSHKKKAIVKESCWCLSNITAGNPEQIQMVLKNSDQIKSLMKLRESPELEGVDSVLWIFSNATEKATSAQISVLCEYNLIEFFCGYLKSENSKNIKNALDGIASVLNHGAQLAAQNNTDNLFRVKFDEKGGIELLEGLQSHPSAEIYEKTFKILETYYEVEDI